MDTVENAADSAVNRATLRDIDLATRNAADRAISRATDSDTGRSTRRAARKATCRAIDSATDRAIEDAALSATDSAINSAVADQQALIAEQRGIIARQKRILKITVTDIDYQCWFILSGGVPECPHERLETLIPIHNDLLSNGNLLVAEKVEAAIAQEIRRASME